MALPTNFNGTTIYKPGAYSISNQSNANGAPLASEDTLFLVGEASKGAPGSVTGIQQFTAEQLPNLIAVYGSGPIVDAALAAVRPSKQSGIGGAGVIQVWKTNASTDAFLIVKEATNTSALYTISDLAWGSSGNDLSVSISNGSSGLQKNVVINRVNSPSEVLGQNPATAVLSIQYTGNGSAATLAIGGSTLATKTLTTTLTGQTDSSVNLSIVLQNYTISKLIAYINAQPGYTATILDPTKNANQATDLDSIASTGIKSSALSLYRLQQEILSLLNTSKNVSAVLAAVPVIGLPNNITNAFLSGGALGASANSDFSTGLAKSLAQSYSDVLCCISQDASADIAMLATDPGSTYTIASVQAALTSHLVLREQVQNRKEAQGWTGFRNTAFAACYAAAAAIGSELVQMCIQDVLVLDVNANLTWKQPHVFAALCAGIRLGTPIGEPLTHKYLNCNGVGHVVNPATGISAGDFDTNLDGNLAIEAGITFSELVSAGNRIVVDNTTYGIDASFVFNRGSVVEASQYIAQTIRQTAEDAFVGKKLTPAKVSGGKISGGAASSLKSVIRNRLLQLNAPDVNIISSSLDAPNGFVEDTFVVQVTGNTATVAVEVKPVQGLDFIKITFTLGQVYQSA